VITLTREEAQQVLNALRAVGDLTTHDDEVYEAIDIIEPLLGQPEPEYRDVVIKGDLWRIEFLPDHAASVVLVKANYEAKFGRENPPVNQDTHAPRSQDFVP